MPANVGKMFYTGEMPWHGEGEFTQSPLDVCEAVEAGGLDWEVGEVHLMTDELPPVRVGKRKAIVRLDRKRGTPERLLAIVHPGFKPIQNLDAAMLFDEIFGRKRNVYHTGGYLGYGEQVWLLAKLNRSFDVASEDPVDTYALMANSHDGSIAFQIRLTTIRVVCQNTLYMALGEKRFSETIFRRWHKGTIHEHREAAKEFYRATMKQLEAVQDAYTCLAKKTCDDATFRDIVRTLLPKPPKPRNADRDRRVREAYLKRIQQLRAARDKIMELRESGKGMDLDSARGTFWGALNAVLEYVDHHKDIKASRYSHALLGSGMEFKRKAFQLIWHRAMAT